MLSSVDRIPEKVAREIQNPERSIFLSAVSSVEIAIKRSIGKLKAPSNLLEEAQERGLLELPFRYEHGEAIERLQTVHEDPFDRM